MFIGRTSKTSLFKIPVTGIHADKISAARKKEKTGASSSQETEVISVRERERIRQRAPLRILPRGQDAMGIDKFQNSIERI